ncbi:maleylpyruvate isomerase family mycothiol-dependent enzyme [Amycolatopsis sp. PS_44_ISF1]|uniref:maleylpyruvate isomerase family mycothiol-dependent enzyme n=1 Tax=Amycolatopsis sp. PS_44_ISF1 TaxID=2974917 RepID=UPI0028E02655|nr:maleylpyruvate isomerase family mycothiol-dependent enzyme [Amycolatopsis sp. PS_44_ISF1]MDT8914555.1 maleylpyruvate isomerase family mycothiol-dependent enzyme [Amycolatopsis sp. PS_44_ISF1]
MTALPPAAYLPHLRTLTRAFAEGLRTGEPGAPVPDCGGWTRADLGAHLGHVHRWAAEVVRTGEPRPQEFGNPPSADLPGWYAESASVLLDALAEADPEASCWHFGATARTKAFWFRRQVHETAVHLIDLTEAAELDPVIAADGVSEVFEAILPRIARRHAVPPLAAPITLRATDTGHSWTLVPGEPPALGEAEAVATVEAPARNLVLRLWKRTVAEPRITGDEAVATAFLRAPLTP